MYRTILLFLLAGGLCGDTPPALPPGSVTFAQFTDAHIFDDGYRQPTPKAMQQAANDREALHWAIDEVNRAVASGTAIDFVVYTGDLGLQNIAMPDTGACHALPVHPDPGVPQSTLAWAVSEIAGELNQLAVRQVFLLPGNNDIFDEQITDRRFDCFLAELRKAVQTFPRPLALDTLRLSSPIDVNGVRIVALNSASFKKKDNYATACTMPAAPLDQACPEPQMKSLDQLAAEKMPLLLFTHVPDLIDPYFHSQHPGLRKSAWDIPAGARTLWEKAVCKGSVSGVFAGHFHDSNVSLYGSNATTKDLAYSDCVTAKTWLAPPLALKNQERTLARARGFLIATVTGGKVTRVQVNWFDSPLPPSIQDLNSPKSAHTSKTAFVSLAAALLLGLAAARFSQGDNRMLSKDLSALGYAVAFAALTLALVWFAKEQLGITESAVLIAFLLCPLLIYGVVSGRLTEFSGPGGWGAKFAQATIDPVTSPIDVTSAQDIPKVALPETLQKIQQIHSGKPVVLTLTLGTPSSSAGFGAYPVANAIANLLAYPNFRFVVFLHPDRRLLCYIPGWLLKPALESGSPGGNALMNAANSGNPDVVRGYPGMRTETISPSTTNAQALQAMEKLEIDAIPVVDPSDGRLAGVVSRDRILSGMLLALAKGAKN